MMIARPAEEDFPLWEVPNMKFLVLISWHEVLLVMTAFVHLVLWEQASPLTNSTRT